MKNFDKRLTRLEKVVIPDGVRFVVVLYDVEAARRRPALLQPVWFTFHAMGARTGAKIWRGRLVRVGSTHKTTVTGKTGGGGLFY